MIMLMLGGMSIPKVPPAATEPNTKRSLYFLAFIAGTATVPIVAAVATDEPEMAANRPHETILECSSPPGSGDSQYDSVRYMRSVTPARTKISPNNTNKGMQVRMKLFREPHIVLPNDIKVGVPR